MYVDGIYNWDLLSVIIKNMFWIMEWSIIFIFIRGVWMVWFVFISGWIFLYL